MSFLFVAEGNNEESRLEFTEDEETLIDRMYNLIGQRFVVPWSFSSCMF